ncbi:hypothetical protein HXX01_00265 [Candidatus Nomurabacteria bacterium]|nr:hypothetical protein [Candidatus Nomurabacteria bacterium]
MIFFPHRTYTYGVEDILGYINQTFPYFRDISGYYYGAEKNSEDQALTEKQRLFKINKLSLLVATKAFGMGIDKPNIRYTIHLNMPPSIESYYQEAGRAGRDQNDSYCYILYHKDVDKKINLSFFNNSFKGQERELGYVNELLAEITFPYSDNVRRIQELVVDELGIIVKINRWQQHGFDRLYINSDEVYSIGNQQRNKSFGYINVPDLSSVVESDVTRAYGDYGTCKKVLDQLVQFIKTEKPSGAPAQQWLDTLFQIPKKPGIEEVLRKTNEEYSYIEIGFENDKINQLNDYLRNKYDQGFNEYIIRSAISYCESPQEFAKNLTNKYHAATGHWLDFDVRDEILADPFIRRIFPQIRLDQDTYKAVYRLSLLGVISDFTVDYRTRMVSATLRKCSDAEIISELKKYIGLYEPQVIVDQIDQKLTGNARQYSNSVLKEAIKYLIEFIYDRIADKRRRAIDEMERAILAGFGKSGNSAFEEAVYFYFDSKITPELRADLKSLQEVNLDLVWKYITKTKGKSDEIGHLRGACSRLLIENPDNPVLFLLMAFANYSTPDYDLKVAQADFRKGWELFLTKYQMSFSEYEAGLKKFIELTIGFNKFTKKLLEPELVRVKIHFLEANPSRLDAVFDILETSKISDLNQLIILKMPGENSSVNFLCGILWIHDNDAVQALRFLKKSIDDDFFLNEGLFNKLMNYAKNKEEIFKAILAQILVELEPSYLNSIHKALEDDYTSTVLLEQIINSIKRINNKAYEQFGQIK